MTLYRVLQHCPVSTLLSGSRVELYWWKGYIFEKEGAVWPAIPKQKLKACEPGFGVTYGPDWKILYLFKEMRKKPPNTRCFQKCFQSAFFRNPLAFDWQSRTCTFLLYISILIYALTEFCFCQTFFPVSQVTFWKALVLYGCPLRCHWAISSSRVTQPLLTVCRVRAQLCASRLWLTDERGSRSQIIPHIWLFPRWPCWTAGVLSKHRGGTIYCGSIPFLTSGGAIALLWSRKHCDKSINRVGGRLCRLAVNWQASPQIVGPAIFSRGGWRGVMGFIWPHRACFCYRMQLWRTCTPSTSAYPSSFLWPTLAGHVRACWTCWECHWSQWQQKENNSECHG